MKILVKVVLMLLLAGPTFSQWTQIPGNTWTINSFYQYGSTFYACTNGGTVKSTDEGTTWSSTGSGGNNNYSFTYKSASAMVAGFSNGIRYYNSGGYWWNSDITWETRSVITDGTNFFAGTSAGVYKSTNNGQNWVLLGIGATNVKCLLKVNSYLFAGHVGGIYISSNNGSNWDLITYPIYVNAFAYANSLLWVGTMGQLNYSDDYCQTFLGPTGPDTTYSIATNASNIYIGSARGVKKVVGSMPGLYYTIFRNGGFPIPAPTINAIIVTNNYLLAGTNSGIWRAPISYVTGLDKIGTAIPDRFSLSQNYPNPFNPSTTIRYQISKEGTITLKIFDITGKELETLVNENQSPSTYEVTWNASKYSSGVYFYKIESDNFSEIRKMILAK